MANSKHENKIRLEELIEVKHGFAFQGEYIHEAPPGDILLTPGNFNVGGGYKGDKLKYYNGPLPEGYFLSKGDLVVTMTDLSKMGDTLGYPALLPDPPKSHRFLHNQRLGKVIIKDPKRLDKRFLFYRLCCSDYRDHVLASATGTTVKHTSPSRILSFSLEVPVLREQIRIVEILGSIDDKIDLNRHMNQTLEEMSRAIFKSWFVDFDPVRAKAEGYDPGLPAEIGGLFPDAFDESLGEIPRGWRLGNIGESFSLTMGQSPPGSTYNETGDGLPFYQGRADFGFRYPTRRVYCSQPSRFALAGDTLVSVRAPVGDMNMASERCAIGRGVAAVRHYTGSRSYTYYALRSVQRKFEQFEAQGTVFGSINKTDFANIPILIPDELVVQKFEDLCYPFDQRIEINMFENITLEEIRDSLLPKLMSGDITF